MQHLEVVLVMRHKDVLFARGPEQQVGVLRPSESQVSGCLAVMPATLHELGKLNRDIVVEQEGRQAD